MIGRLFKDNGTATHTLCINLFALHRPTPRPLVLNYAQKIMTKNHNGILKYKKTRGKPTNYKQKVKNAQLYKRQLMLVFDNNIIPEEVFLVLYDINRPSNTFCSHWDYILFDLLNFAEAECYTVFQFNFIILHLFHTK